MSLYSHEYLAIGFLKEAKLTKQEFILPDGARFFDLSSMTKALATTALIFRMRQDAGLSFDDPVSKWAKTMRDLPVWLAHEPLKNILAHRSGLPWWSNFYSRSSVDAARHAFVDVLTEPPKSKAYAYSDVGFILLGLILESHYGKPLAQIFDAFGSEIGYGPSLAQRVPGWTQASIPTVTRCPLRGVEVRGFVHDENCWALGGASGHSGLFASGPGVVQYLRQLLDVCPEIFQENASVRHASKPEPYDDGLLGWRQGLGRSSDTFYGGQGIGHLGFTGTMFFVLPEGRFPFVVHLTNRVLGERMPGDAILQRRREVCALATQLTAGNR